MSDVWKALKIEETTGSKKKTNNLNKYKKNFDILSCIKVNINNYKKQLNAGEIFSALYCGATFRKQKMVKNAFS